MRSVFFRLLLTLLEKHTPSWIKSIQIQILLNATAAAFGRPRRRVWHLSGADALAAYAAYTTDCMSSAGSQKAPAGDCQNGPDAGEGCHRGPDIDRRRIFRVSYRLGRRIRRITGFCASSDMERLVFWLYRNIGIRVTGHLPGEILIPACYFSSIYTPEQCRLMSLMDWGIIAGICGGGKLIFTERLTQGCGRCRACLTQKGLHTEGNQCR